MRKPDVEVREVVCYETGKPMPKIPAWMAEIKVKFVSDEARQRHPAPTSLIDIEPVRRLAIADADIDVIKATSDGDEDEESDFDVEVEVEVESEETEDIEASE